MNKLFTHQKKIKNGYTSKEFNQKTIWLILILGATFFSYLRLRLAGMPLERDEGEYAYIGKLILDGIMPYKAAYNMKLPGTYFMYSIIEFLFGKTETGIHIGVWIFNLATVFLLFAAVKKFFNPMIALITSLSFGFISISDNYLGFAGHATHFVTFFVALAIFFLVKFNESKKPVYVALTGLMFGLAFLMKQQAVMFIIFGGAMIFVNDFLDSSINKRSRILNLIIFSIGAVIPYLLIVLLMLLTHNFAKFWFWTFDYARSYTSQFSFADGVYRFKQSFFPIFQEYWLFWICVLAGIVLLFYTKLSKLQKAFALAYFLFAFLATCPGYYFREHYFIPLIPAAALMAAIFIDFLSSYLSTKNILNIKYQKYFPIVIFVVFICSALFKRTEFYFTASTESLCSSIYPFNPFKEAIPMARYINKNSSPKDEIAILGSEPELLFYADRKSATGYIYTYDLMLNQPYSARMNAEMIAEMEKSKPLFVVFCNMKISWTKREDSPTDLFKWFYKNIVPNYEMVGLADVVAADKTNYYWGEEANRQPESKEFIALMKRKLPN